MQEFKCKAKKSESFIPDLAVRRLILFKIELGHLSKALNHQMHHSSFHMWKSRRHHRQFVQIQLHGNNLEEGDEGDREREEWEGKWRLTGVGGHLRCPFLLIKLMEKDEEVAFNLG